MESSSAKIVEYRNGIYQGFIKNGKRNGLGILIADSGQIFVGSWKNDLLYGQSFVQLNYQEYGFGDFNRGQIQGNFIFRNKGKTLFGEFNSSRPISPLLLIDKDLGKTKVINYRNVLEKQQLYSTQGMTESEIIDQLGKKKMSAPNLLNYLQSKFDQNFQIQSLPNSNYLFMWNDPANPLSVGFTINKSGNLISYGVYQNNKLNGLGCKFQNNIRYQGTFKNGFIDGKGLKYSKGKYSYGSFEQGNLIQAIHLEERSPDLTQQKLNELKKLEHIKSMNFINSYIRANLLRFKGFIQLTYESQTNQQYFYSKVQYKNTLTKNIANQFAKQRDFQTKSSRSFLKNPEQIDKMSEFNQKSRKNVMSNYRMNN